MNKLIKNTVRCIGCGHIYDRNEKANCPRCRAILCDKVLITIPVVEERVIVDFGSILMQPIIFGLPITSRN